MPGLVPGIHVLLLFASTKDVDGRDKPGHDEHNDTLKDAGVTYFAFFAASSALTLASNIEM